MVMGRNGHGQIWLWADLVMGRNDPEPFEYAWGKISFSQTNIIKIAQVQSHLKLVCE